VVGTPAKKEVLLLNSFKGKNLISTCGVGGRGRETPVLIEVEGPRYSGWGLAGGKEKTRRRSFRIGQGGREEERRR